MRNYILDLLEFHIRSENLFFRKHITLTEMWHASMLIDDDYQKKDKLKALADRALYLSGYFAESFDRKLIDIDFYIQMGSMAYETLAKLSANQDIKFFVFEHLAQKFPQWVDLINYIAIKTIPRDDVGLLRLYEQFLKTGSQVAKNQLLERGVVTLPQEQLKKSQQDE